ncbi:RluA family pseudouridine synthase [Candidatus Beckwithbacteria bacterium CG10_big_fil_rev_8_21_14_0_10_34_10]|uniref:Pseudouridine synthase n=1 Tax=Candidatus Beckwithbacteria bacterium CG10_big_fil_rev_8_21_14_0_10_34_10 TaxID=1974495 RepID=A0A2H0W7Q6_9BACT|nr:MAG: RluA family pseudouridine synthase [Candidatus Beckwithbacteria bacterium CG10_big_fil_rev_8_21_14_0_10_34_10]
MPEPSVLFQDSYLLVINKPSGLVVNRAESVKEKTLQDWMEEKYPKIFDLKNIKALTKNKDNISEEEIVFLNRSGLVHRLDKDTSGLMVLAKNSKTLFNLQSQFKQRKVIKKYYCLVHGKVEPKVGDIRLPLGRKPQDSRKFTVRLAGRKAVTEYKVLKYLSWENENFSFVEVNLKTGRTHQIRVHFKYLSHPLVGDKIYLSKKRYKKDLLWCPRLFLHSFFLSFSHPDSLKKLEFKTDLPADLEKIVE